MEGSGVGQVRGVVLGGVGLVPLPLVGLLVLKLVGLGGALQAGRSSSTGGATVILHLP